VLDPQECFRNALPRARACVPQGTPPDPLERPVKTVLFLEFWRLRGPKPAQNQRAAGSSRFPKEALFLRRCRRFLNPSLFYVVFYVFSLRKARILRCFGGGNGPKSVFWCPKGTCFMKFSKLPLGAGTHHQKHCFFTRKIWPLWVEENRFSLFSASYIGQCLSEKRTSRRFAPFCRLRGSFCVRFEAKKTLFFVVSHHKNAVFFHGFEACGPPSGSFWCLEGTCFTSFSSFCLSPATMSETRRDLRVFLKRK